MSYLAGGKGGGPRPTNGVDNSDPISSAIVKYNYQVHYVNISKYLLSTIYRLYLLTLKLTLMNAPPWAGKNLYVIFKNKE